MSATPSIRNRLFSVIAVVVGGLLFFCPVLLAADSLKVGGVFSITGPASFLGDPEKKSMEMVVDAINSAGGIDGRMLEAVIYDTEGDPQRAVNAVSKLINRDGVIAIIGPSLTPTTLAVKNLVESAKIPLISCAAGIQITQPVTPWVFKTAQSDVMAVATVYRHIQKSGLKTVGLLSVANAFGESGKQQLEEQAAAFGLQVVAAEKFGDKDSDMTAQLTKIRKAAPDAVVCWGTNPGPAVLVEPLQRPVVAFVQAPVADHRNPHQVHRVHHDPEGPDGPFEHRGVGHIKREALGRQEPGGVAGLGDPFRGQIHVSPSGEPVFAVPDALAVSQQNELKHLGGPSLTTVGSQRKLSRAAQRIP